MQRVYARHGACADSASRLGAARRPAPAPRSHGRNRYCRDRKRCRCSPALRSPDTYTAGRSSPAPHATRQKTVDKFVQCAHNSQADRPIQAPHRRPGVRPRKSSPGPSSSFALCNSIANISHRVAQQVTRFGVPIGDKFFRKTRKCAAVGYAHRLQIGLILASKTGLILESASEDDIAGTSRQLLQLGQDILDGRRGRAHQADHRTGTAS